MSLAFTPVKIITSGEGGMATTNDPKLAQSMADLRSHGITKDEKRFEFPSPGPWSYEQQNLGFNYRMTDLQAALGSSQLQRLDQIIVERQRLHSSIQKTFNWFAYSSALNSFRYEFITSFGCYSSFRF